jgi:hypothetical protein
MERDRLQICWLYAFSGSNPLLPKFLPLGNAYEDRTREAAADRHL